MLKIKLARFGKKNQPTYRIVINEAKTKRDGKYNAAIGVYEPTKNPKVLEIDLKEYEKWVSRGAQPTDTVASLVKRYKSGEPLLPKKKKVSKKAKAKLKKQEEAKELVKKEKASKAKTEKKEEKVSKKTK